MQLSYDKGSCPLRKNIEISVTLPVSLVNNQLIHVMTNEETCVSAKSRYSLILIYTQASCQDFLSEKPRTRSTWISLPTKLLRQSELFICFWYLMSFLYVWVFFLALFFFTGFNSFNILYNFVLFFFQGVDQFGPDANLTVSYGNSTYYFSSEKLNFFDSEVIIFCVFMNFF